MPRKIVWAGSKTSSSLPSRLRLQQEADACGPGQAQAALDGGTVYVYSTPYIDILYTVHRGFVVPQD